MRFIKAVKIFDGKTFLPPGTVLVYDENGRMQNIADITQVSDDKVEIFDGILAPGFINAHCHLELSHLKSSVARGKGFCAFAIELMSKRGKFEQAAIEEAMAEAETEMLRNGIVAVGDISNADTSLVVKARKKLFYHTFIELIGLDPRAAQSIFEKGKSLLQTFENGGIRASLSPHAPYSASVELIRLISAYNLKWGLPLSIHNQESIEEHRFFMGEKSQVHDLYRHLDIRIDFFEAPRTSSLSHYLPSLSGHKNILVHNTFTSETDAAAGENKKVFWCFCPGANLYIENRLPAIQLFLNQASRICIGTDSLASNSSLDVVKELNHLSKACPGLDEPTLLAMICSNGAKALGIENEYGSLVPGRNTGLNHLRITDHKFELVNKVL